MAEFCGCGLIKQNKVGADEGPDGVLVCRACGLPHIESATKAGVPLAAIHAAQQAPAVLIVTTNDVPGYRIDAVHGDVFGLIVRARNVFSNWGASLRTVVGGEVAGYTKLLADSRREARERLKAEARSVGANAVVAMRFDCNEIGDIMSEIAAYGTAVTISPIESPASPA